MNLRGICPPQNNIDGIGYGVGHQQYHGGQYQIHGANPGVFQNPNHLRPPQPDVLHQPPNNQRIPGLNIGRYQGMGAEDNIARQYINQPAPAPPMDYFQYMAAQGRLQQRQDGRQENQRGRQHVMALDAQIVENHRHGVPVNPPIERDNGINELRDHFDGRLRRIERAVNRLRPQNDGVAPPAFLKFNSIQSIEDFENTSEDKYEELITYMSIIGGNTLKAAAAAIIRATLSNDFLATVTIKRREEGKSLLLKTRFLKACYAALRRIGKFGNPTNADLSTAMSAGLKCCKLVRQYHIRRGDGG